MKGYAPDRGLDKQDSTERVNAAKSDRLKCIVSLHGLWDEVSMGCGSFEVLWLLLSGPASIYNSMNPLYTQT